MKLLRTGLLLLTGILVSYVTSAQEQGDTAKLYAEMKQLQGIYQQSPLSFDIRYTYTSEQHPETILDSLSGHMDISGRNYHYSISTTEMTANEQYVVTLFKEDGIMYLSKPSAVSPVDPIEQMRATMQAAGISNCAVAENGGVKTIRVSFKPGMPYKEFNMDFNKKTGMLMEMKYVLKTTMLMESLGGENTDKIIAQYGEYATVRCYFTNYQPLPQVTDVFDSSRFFYKAGNEFKATDAYKTYQVFVGTPNLQ